MNLSNRLLFALAVAGLAISACATEGEPARGEELAQAYCASCHRFPEPALLDKTSWTAVLPDMGARLGVYTTITRDSLLKLSRWNGLNPLLIYPADPRISLDNWQSITDYYLKESPETLPAQKSKPRVITELPGFAVRTPPERFALPYTTLMHIDEERRLFFAGNVAVQNTLTVVGSTGQSLFNWQLEGDPISVIWKDDALYILIIGPDPSPAEAASGSIQVVDGPDAPLRPLITGLKRPVHMVMSDLNGSGRDDFVVCEYGHHDGSLSWFEAMTDTSYRRHVLRRSPGSVRAAVHDFNGDGLPDILALMAQGDEGFDLYLNQGNGRFEVQRLLRFPPVFGSNSFELADFDGDGKLDILYVNGDNADVTPVLKPYHGLRIFLAGNEGLFHQHYFYPLHGAVAARVRDFDGDGDLDIAAISYFPDYAEAPEESFVLLENQGDLRFQPRTFEDAQRGRWLTMDAGDFDGDGDPDIILGSHIGFAPLGDETGLYDRWLRESPGLIILQNAR